MFVSEQMTCRNSNRLICSRSPCVTSKNRVQRSTCFKRRSSSIVPAIEFQLFEQAMDRKFDRNWLTMSNGFRLEVLRRKTPLPSLAYKTFLDPVPKAPVKHFHFISGMDFSSSGDHLAVSTHYGILSIFNFSHLTARNSGVIEPSCSTETIPLYDVKWVGQKLICNSEMKDYIEEYTLEAGLSKSEKYEVRQGFPTYKSQNTSLEGIKCVVVNLQEPYRLFASGKDGNVYSWDSRACKFAIGKFLGAGDAEINTLCLDGNDNNLFYGGTGDGKLIKWDFRIGYKPIECEDVIKLISNMKVLRFLEMEDDDLPRWIEDMKINPLDKSNLCCTMNVGWYAFLNTSSFEVHHVSSPGKDQEHGIDYRRGAWYKSRFLVGESYGWGRIQSMTIKTQDCPVLYLDPEDPLWGTREDGSEGFDSEWTPDTIIKQPKIIRVGDRQITTVAAHPVEPIVVAGGCGEGDELTMVYMTDKDFPTSVSIEVDCMSSNSEV